LLLLLLAVIPLFILLLLPQYSLCRAMKPELLLINAYSRAGNGLMQYLSLTKNGSRHYLSSTQLGGGPAH